MCFFFVCCGFWPGNGAIQLATTSISETNEIVEERIYWNELNSVKYPVDGYYGLVAFYDGILYGFGGVLGAGGRIYDVYWASMDDIMNDDYDTQWSSYTWNYDSSVSLSIDAIITGSSNGITVIDNLAYFPSIEYNENMLLIFDMDPDAQVPIAMNTYTYTMIGYPTQYNGCSANNRTHLFYLAGGANGVGTFATLQIYDIGTDSWSFGSNMTYARLVPACTFDYVNNVIWILGGIDGGTQHDQIEYYKLNENRWYTLPNTKVCALFLLDLCVVLFLLCCAVFFDVTVVLFDIYFINLAHRAKIARFMHTMATKL